MIVKNKKGLWCVDTYSPEKQVWYKIKHIIAKKRTPFQEVLILDTKNLGKALVIDEDPQSFEDDEFIYHEALIHPAMICYGRPKKILVLGAGEGATMREILKYKSVKEIKAVDIDIDVTNLCKKYLKCMHKGSFDDPKTKLIISDAADFLKNTKEKFDIIISDLTDPYEGGASLKLYTKEFFKLIRKRLAKKGIFVMQAQELEETEYVQHNKDKRIVKTIFPKCYSHRAYVPSFAGTWSFIICSLGNNPKKLSQNIIEKRLKENSIKNLKYYSAKMHSAMFTFPPVLEKLLAKDK